jgi:hypothetical protein
MKTTATLTALMLCSVIAMAKDSIQVDVKAVHAVTHEARDARAITERGIMGAGSPGRSVEVYNLDAVINGDKVVLACQDDRGCQAPALGTYEGELKRGHVKISFELPVTHKKVSHWYKIAGAW